MAERGQRVLGSGAVAGSRKHMLPPKGKESSREKTESCCFCLCQSLLKQRVLIFSSQPASPMPSEGPSRWHSGTAPHSIPCSLPPSWWSDGRGPKRGHTATPEVFPTSLCAYRVTNWAQPGCVPGESCGARGRLCRGAGPPWAKPLGCGTGPWHRSRSCCWVLGGRASWGWEESSGRYIGSGWMGRMGDSWVGGLQIVPDFTSLSNVDCINAKGKGLRPASAQLNILTAGAEEIGFF